MIPTMEVFVQDKMLDWVFQYCRNMLIWTTPTIFLARKTQNWNILELDFKFFDLENRKIPINKLVTVQKSQTNRYI